MEQQQATPAQLHAPGQLVDELTNLRAGNAALRAENLRLRDALANVCGRLHDDAVNGHLLPAQAITRDGIGEVYEIARAAIAESK